MTSFVGHLQDIIHHIAKLDANQIYEVKIQEHKSHRTLTQNAYYWQLLNQMADWVGEDKLHYHNELISHYGQPKEKKFQLIRTTEDVYSQEEHLRPTTKIIHGADKIDYKLCIVMRGTSTYNTKEMAKMIDGLINEIKGSEAPIETMTYREMAELWNY